ncbi:MAG: hypothetical protein QXI12_12755, partial [Candidatus Methanomethyliaceae archaeon]
MAKLSIFRLADLYGIKVLWEDVHGIVGPDVDGWADTRDGIIHLDLSIQGTRHGKCVADEEVGHCLYPPMANHLVYHSRRYWRLSHDERDNLRWWAAKDERRARLWATRWEIADEDFWHFFSTGPHDWQEWLERFEVVDWFMDLKVGFMREKQPFKWR